MTDKAIRSKWGRPEDEQLHQALARSQAAPDYTMGALAQQTGVPPDTLRSWERRYGYPTPARSDTNRRLYSERDIVAVRWLREQTEQGQGISEAVAMLLARMPAAGSPPVTPHPPPTDAPSQSEPAPFPALRQALVNGQMDAAQSAWDDTALALSPAAIGGVILQLDRAIDLDAQASTDRARAFLLRKAMLLLDHADPDRGHHIICLATAKSDTDAIPATVLAATLARDGYRVITPFPEITSLAAVDAVHHLDPAMVILVGASAAQRKTFERLLPDTPVHHWSPEDGTEALHTWLDSLE